MMVSVNTIYLCVVLGLCIYLIIKNGALSQINTNINQPCYSKDGQFLGWYSRSVAVASFIFCKNKFGNWCVLASERGKGAADYQGLWNCPCGYLDFNETLADAAHRETLEETGVNISPEEFKVMGINDSPDENRQNVTIRHRVIIDKKTTDDFIFSHEKNEKDEVGEIRWVPLNEVNFYQWAFGHEKLIPKMAFGIE